MKTKIAILTLLAGILIFSGCTISDANLQQKIIEANTKLDYYTMDMDMDMATETEFLGQKMSIDTKMEATGKIDRPNKMMVMVSETTTEANGMENVMDSETYIIGDEVYTKVMGSWMKMEMQQDMWNTQDQIEQTTELIKSGTLERLKDQTLDGKSYYVVKIDPDVKKLTELVMKQQQDSPLMREMGESIADMIKEYSAIIWVNKKTFIIEKTRTDMKMEITPEDVGAAEGASGVSMDFVVDASIYAVGKKPTITVPEEALNAMDISDFQQQMPSQMEEDIVVEYN